MRILFSTTAGAGHFGPLVPIARACGAAGHEVAVAAPQSFAASVTGVGLHHLPFPDPAPEQVGPLFARLPALPLEEANRLVIQEIFGRADAQAALPGLVSILDEWRPDVVVREPAELASLVAAERAGINQVHVAISLAQVAGWMIELLEEPPDQLRELAGVQHGRALELQAGSTTFSSVPLLLDGLDAGETTGSVWRYRDGSPATEAALPPTWGDPAAPLVYVSYGSVAASLGPFGDLYPTTIEALADLPIRVLMTTGRPLDPAELGPVPANVRVEAWCSQREVMPAAAAVIGHGGFGTTMTALAAGVPQLVVPLFASDQYVNAERVAAVGAGLEVHGGPGVTTAFPGAVRQLLEDEQYRSGAGAVASAIAALPDVSLCVPRIEALAR